MAHAIAKDEVHVWYLFSDSVGEGAWLDACRSMMSAAERQRHERFAFDRHRRRFLISRGLLRTVLSRYADVEPAALQFVENEHGRPELARASILSPVRFNFSHTDGLLACAVALDREVGIDVEYLERHTADADVARRYFSPQEVADLQALPPSERRHAFFDYWTLKEAYVKARGMGLSIPLDQFTIHLAPDRPVTISFGPGLTDDPSSWQFARFRPGPAYRMALAVRRDAQSHIRIVTRDFAATLPFDAGASVSYVYREHVLEALAQHGLRPLHITPPDRAWKQVSELYCYELRKLRERFRRSEIQKNEYAGHVVTLRKRYRLLSVPISTWAARTP